MKKKINCPKCGEPIVLNGLGRKPLAIPVIKVYDAIRVTPNITTAADLLECSRGYIYKVLKENNLTRGLVLKGKAPK